MNKFGKKLVCGILTASMAVAGLTGCGQKNLDGTQTAATVGEDKISLGLANLTLRYQQAGTTNYYNVLAQNYGINMGDAIWDNQQDGVTAGEELKNTVMDNLHKQILLRVHASEYSVTITDEEKEKINAAAEAFISENEKSVMKKMGVTKEIVAEMLELSTYESKMYDALTADVDTEVSDEEAKQSRISYVKISTAGTTDDSGYTTELTDDEKAAKKAQAQQVLDKINASDDPAEADMSALAKEVDESLSGSSTTYGSDDEVLDDKLKEAVKGLDDGDVCQEVVEGTDGYYVVRLDSDLDKDATDTKKANIVTERKNDAFNAKVDEWKAAVELKTEEAWNEIKVTDSDPYNLKTEAPDDTDGADSTGEPEAGADE